MNEGAENGKGYMELDRFYGTDWGLNDVKHG